MILAFCYCFCCCCCCCCCCLCRCCSCFRFRCCCCFRCWYCCCLYVTPIFCLLAATLKELWSSDAAGGDYRDEMAVATYAVHVASRVARELQEELCKQDAIRWGAGAGRGTWMDVVERRNVVFVSFGDQSFSDAPPPDEQRVLALSSVTSEIPEGLNPLSRPTPPTPCASLTLPTSPTPDPFSTPPPPPAMHEMNTPRPLPFPPPVWVCCPSASRTRPP